MIGSQNERITFTVKSKTKKALSEIAASRGTSANKILTDLVEEYVYNNTDHLTVNLCPIEDVNIDGILDKPVMLNVTEEGYIKVTVLES